MAKIPLVTKADEWIPVDHILAVIKDKRWNWTRNSECKYLNLRVDTRTLLCQLRNRDDYPVSLKEISAQYDRNHGQIFIQPELVTIVPVEESLKKANLIIKVLSGALISLSLATGWLCYWVTKL